MNYIVYPLSILLYFFLCYVAGRVAKNRPLGYDLGLLIAIFLTPVISIGLSVSGVKIRPRDLWWKLLAGGLVLYALIGGMLMPVPKLVILNETIRNLYYHVPMWFGMVIIFFVSVYYSIKYLSTNNIHYDLIAREAVNTGFLYGILGMVTGMVWARFTWGAFWVPDPKLEGAGITLLIYLAYLILRLAVDEESNRARLSAVFNIFAFSLLLVFIFIRPRLSPSLHPGNGGNPAFSTYDLNNQMRYVFYPAVIGWGLLAVWITQLQVRLSLSKRRHFELENDY